MDPKQDFNKEPAQPGTPLEPAELDEELEGSDMEKRGYYEEKPSLPQPERGRKAPTPATHPTAELATGHKSRSPGKPSGGTHPTAELDIRRKR